MYIYLEDGSVFQGRGITASCEAVGLVSYYTGVVGYQELISDPANHGKILLFTYPEIGNYGVNSEDAESDAPVVSGVIAKEYCPYYSNFRAEKSLKDYLDTAGKAMLDDVDTRAILLSLREKGEMWGVISPVEISADDCQQKIAKYRSELAPKRMQKSAGDYNVDANGVSAKVLDFGAGKSFYKTLAARGINVVDDESAADLVIVSPVPFYAVDNAEAIAEVKGYIGKKPVLGISDGAALVAAACGAKTRWMGFGHHGVNLPVRFIPTDRKEITVQNHHFVVECGGAVETIFDNVNDQTSEGFAIKSERAVGVGFVPDDIWVADILRVLEVV